MNLPRVHLGWILLGGSLLWHYRTWPPHQCWPYHDDRISPFTQYVLCFRFSVYIYIYITVYVYKYLEIVCESVPLALAYIFFFFLQKKKNYSPFATSKKHRTGQTRFYQRCTVLRIFLEGKRRVGRR